MEQLSLEIAQGIVDYTGTSEKSTKNEKEIRFLIQVLLDQNINYDEGKNNLYEKIREYRELELLSYSSENFNKGIDSEQKTPNNSSDLTIPYPNIIEIANTIRSHINKIHTQK